MDNIFNSQDFDLSREEVELLAKSSAAIYQREGSEFLVDNVLVEQGWENITPELVAEVDEDGLFANEEAAAGVFRKDNTIVLAFRGTDSVADVPFWIRRQAHYELFNELTTNLDIYVESNDISEVLATGHSLGGAMTEIFLENHNDTENTIYFGVTIASPTAGELLERPSGDPDRRVLNIGYENDLIYGATEAGNVNSEVSTTGIYIDVGGASNILDFGFSTDLPNTIFENIASIEQSHHQDHYAYTVDRITSSEYYEQIQKDDLVIVDRTDSFIDAIAYPETENAFIFGQDNEDDILRGYSANDTIEGKSGNDSLFGEDLDGITSTEDVLDGGAGDDLLNGGGGNDVLKGGDDNDTAVFSDNFENYEYSIDNDTITFDHIRGTQTDGIDTLTNIEFAQFSDRRVSLPLNNATDVIFLQDLSNSFNDDLPTLKSLAPSLVDTLVEENSNTFFGVASFIDRPDDPDGDPNDYFYRTELPITDSENSIISTINSLSTISGGDEPEAQLTALLEIATRTEELGYRDGSTRYVFLSTDASYQEGGIYPNVEQVKVALEESNITPIFLVNSSSEAPEVDVPSIYNGLVERLGRGEVLSLSANSSNITDAVRQAFAEIDDEVTTSGTDENDALTGDDSDEGIFGGLGDDTIDGASGDDVLDGGGGDDELSGSEGDDELVGGTGLDVLDGGSGSDLIEGGLDADTLTGSEAADTFSGTLDELNDDVILDFTDEDRIAVKDANFTEDDLTVTEGSAILDIDANSDETIDATITLEGDFSNFDFVVESESTDDLTNTVITIEPAESSGNELNGTNGDDNLVGSDKNEVLIGNGGNDTLEGLDGEDELDGGSGDDLLEGGQQNDILNGGEDNDTLRGSGGEDELFGGSGNDELKGSSGDDRAFGEAGSDLIFGGSDNDELFGDGGNDTLVGGIGSDSLDGGSGSDRISGVDPEADDDFGRETIDVLTGGEGSNTFVLGQGEDVFYDSGISNNLGTSDYALITDFQFGQDSLELAGSRSNYSFGFTSDELPDGLAVYYEVEAERELIAVLETSDLTASSENIETAKAGLEIDSFIDNISEIEEASII